jgi:hypothetical protein
VEAAKLALNKGNKQKALLALRKKKYQEQLLEKTEQQLMNLEELVCKIFISPILQQANLHFFPQDTFYRICFGRKASIRGLKKW